MNTTRSYQTLFFMILLLAATHVYTMNVQKNYAFALKDCGAGFCIPQEDYDRELPYLLPDKKHTNFLTRTLYAEFMNERLFATAMSNTNQLPAEILNVIMTQSHFIANQNRNLSAEKVLQERHGITYQDLCYLTKAHKQLLLYCVTDAPYNNGILTIEGDDAEFSHEMLERFYSLPIVIQAKLAHHANGNSVYVKTNYALQPSLFNRVLGENIVARDRNVKRLANTALIMTPVTLAVIATVVAMQYNIPHQFSMLYKKALEAQIEMIVEGCRALGIPEFGVCLIMAIPGALSCMPIALSPYALVIGLPLLIIWLGWYAHDQVLNAFNQTLPESMRHRGFQEIFVAPEDNAY